MGDYMSGHGFVKLVYEEKEQLKKEYFDEASQSVVADKIRKLVSDGVPKEQIYELVELILADAYYNLLLGLDGAASLGNQQQEYKIYDESGDLINGCGEIEASAYECFYED
jgi:hypothetical protein